MAVLMPLFDSVSVISNEGIGGFFRQTFKAFEPTQSGPLSSARLPGGIVL